MCDCISYNRPEPDQRTPEVVLPLPPHMVSEVRTTVCIDACIVPQIQALWAEGVITQSCCCGHNGRSLRHVVVARAHAELAREVMSRFSEPLTVMYWALVVA